MVTPPRRCGCQRPIVRWEYDGPSGRLRLFHEACTCTWQLIVIRELLRLPPLQSGIWVQRLSGRYQVTLVRSGGACRARDHAVSLRRFCSVWAQDLWTPPPGSPCSNASYRHNHRCLYGW